MPTWAPSSTTRGEWGTVGVIIDGTDVTYYRDKPVEIPNISLADPYTDETAVLRIPGLTGFGTQPSWLRRLAPVRIYQLDPDGVTKSRIIFAGRIASLDYDTEGCTIECIGAMQAVMRLKMNPQPPFRRTSDIGRRVYDMWRGIGNRGFYGVPSSLGFDIGMTTDRRGSRSETMGDTMAALMQETTQADGTQYTWLRDTPNNVGYRFQLRDVTTEDWTVTFGGHGIDVNVSRDYTEETTAIFGEGVDEAGRRWRKIAVPNVGPEAVPDFPNDDDSPVSVGDTEDDVDNPNSLVALRYELYSDALISEAEFFAMLNDAGKVVITTATQRAWNQAAARAGVATSTTLNTDIWTVVYQTGERGQNLGGATFRPLYIVPAVEPKLYSANWSIVGNNPDYDPDVFPVDRFIAFGEGISRAEAERVAEREINRVYNTAAYRGTITLTLDPEEGHRLDIQPGDNIRLKQFTSNAGLLFHVSGVSINLTDDTIPVTLAVDTVGTALPSLVAQIERDRQRRKDPVWRLSKSRTSTSSDALIPWDDESGSGRIWARDVIGGGWRVSRFLGAEAGIINQVRIDTSPAREFAFAIFGKDPGAAWLQANIGNPLDADAGASPWQDPDLEDALNEREFVEAWGWAGDNGTPCGYGRKAKGDAGASLVGWTADNGQWQYFSENGVWLFLAIWTSGDTEVSGALRAQITEGE